MKSLFTALILLGSLSAQAAFFTVKCYEGVGEHDNRNYKFEFRSDKFDYSEYGEGTFEGSLVIKTLLGDKESQFRVEGELTRKYFKVSTDDVYMDIELRNFADKNKGKVEVREADGSISSYRFKGCGRTGFLP